MTSKNHFQYNQNNDKLQTIRCFDDAKLFRHDHEPVDPWRLLLQWMCDCRNAENVNDYPDATTLWSETFALYGDDYETDDEFGFDGSGLDEAFYDEFDLYRDLL